MARRRPSAARQKKRYQKRLEREWGTKAYHYNQDFHSPYPREFCQKLEAARCKCVIMPSVRQEYARRDYQNIWTSCRNFRRIIGH